jgi:hypothetical protein
MPKHEKNIRDIYIEQATKVARGIIQKTLGKNAGILGSDESVRDIIIKKLMEGFTNFGKTGGEKVKLYFGNYKKNPFTFESTVVSQEEQSERFASSNNTSSFGGSKKTTLSGKQSIKKRRKTKKQRGGNVNPILMVAEIADKVLIPLLFKIPLFITEIVIPIASAQMTKVISKYSAERTQLIVQFILNSVEINISRIANSEECKQSWEIFDQEIETVIDTLDINIEPDRTKKIVVVRGGGDGTFPQLFADLITQSNPAGLSLSEQLFQIASKFPNVFNIINLIPKSVDEFFTIKMFDRILQEAICEEFNDIITGTVITQFYTNIQSFPTSLTIKSGLVLKDFIKINGKPPDVNDNKAEVGLDYNKFMSKMEGFPNTNP